MADLQKVNIPYPDFQYKQTIDSEQFDANNKELQDKVNAAIDVINASKISGVNVPNEISTLAQQLVSLNALVLDLGNVDKAYDVRIKNVENAVDARDARISAIETKNAEQDASYNVLYSEVTRNTGALDTHGDQLDALNQKVDALPIPHEYREFSSNVIMDVESGESLDYIASLVINYLQPYIDKMKNIDSFDSLGELSSYYIYDAVEGQPLNETIDWLANVARSVADLPFSIKFDSKTPTTGFNNRGTIIFNTSPSAGGKVGWVCTLSGSPGTWKPFGLIDA